MSSTRKAPDNSPLSQERYMSSPEYAELRGISGTAVTPRVAILNDSRIRSLIWWLQARSLEEGGLRRIARELMERNADRIGSPSMHRFGMKPGQVYSDEQVREVRKELPDASGFPLRGEILDWDYLSGVGFRTVTRTECDEDTWKESQKHPVSYPAERFIEICSGREDGLVSFLMDFCVNPRLVCEDSKADEKERRRYSHKLQIAFPDQEVKTAAASLWWFRDIVGALLEYEASEGKAICENFVLTKIGAKVWETLDFVVRSRRMAGVLGWEGRGKSEAVKTWCRIHSGEARYVDLSGINSKTSVFRAIAKALGIASSYSRTATEMQARIEDVLQRSGLAVIFDEAHFMWPQSARIYNRPELIDWIDTALANHDVPVGLITTPQFIDCVKRAEDQVGWNWRQFRRRVRRWVVLPDQNTDEDLEKVARKLLPGITRAGIALALNYAKVDMEESPSRDISGLGDIALEARLIAQDDGRENITYEDVETAMNEHLMPSDEAFSTGMIKAAQKIGKRSKCKNLPMFNRPLKADLEPENEATKNAVAAETFAVRKTQSAPAPRGVTPRSSRHSLVSA